MDFMAETVIARPLNDDEHAKLAESLETFSTHYRAHPEDARAILTNGAAPADTTLDPIEIATWAMVANQFLNLDEALTK